MRFKSIRIRNYRSLEDATVDLDGLTVLIGANNAGKTTVLDALSLFGSSVNKIVAGDFNDQETPVELELTMSCEEGEMGIPARFCINGELTVKKRFALDGGRIASDHLAKVMLNADFDRLRTYLTSSEIRSALKGLRPTYADLPPYGKGGKAAWKEKFEAYDHSFYRKHPNHPKVREEYVAWDAHGSPLEGFLDVIHVPSMRDIPNDGGDGSGSYLARLISVAIEDARRGNPRLAAAAEASVSGYGRYVEEIKDSVVAGLNARLAEISGRYVGDSIEIEIAPPDRVLPDPVPSIAIGEGGCRTDIGHVGGGTQRAYLMALLETLSELQGRGRAGGQGTRAKLLVVDEPELYQHPQRQRRMLLAFLGLAGAGGGAMQVICSTHSPHFIDLRQIAGLRLVKAGSPTRILRTTPGRMMRHVLGPEKSRLENGPDRLRTWFDMNATHWMTEGFFSRMAVIMEGPGDRNMLLAAAGAVGVDLDRYEMTLVPVNGKRKIAPVVQIFREFKIPTYVIWDLDYRPAFETKPAHRSHNARIARLASGNSTSGPEAPEKTEVNDWFACFEDNLTASLVEDLERCEKWLTGMREYGELQKARRLDAHPTDPSEYMRRQKRVLNSKEAVFSMLRAIQDKDPGALDAFSPVRVVRRLEEIGKRGAAAA